MEVIALCSGGKDSCYALWLAMKQGHEVAHVVAMLPRREDSWLFHHPNIHLIDLFAECAGLPLLKAETSGVKEEELEDLKHVLSGLDIEGVVSGAIASSYQKSRIERICDELGLKSITPLWGKEPLDLLHEMLSAGFEVIITSVAAQGFDENWLGRKLDKECVNDLLNLEKKYKINISAEGGEYETFVLDAPVFKTSRIVIDKTQKFWDESKCYGVLEIQTARVVPNK